MNSNLTKRSLAIALVGGSAVIVWSLSVDAQSVRSTRNSTVVRGEEGRAAAAGPRGVAVKGDEGYAAAGRHGVVAGNDEAAAAASRRGVVVAGEEGVAAAGRHGVVVGNRYESYEGWRVAAGVAGAAIAVGTMLARPPAAAVTVSVGGASYYYADNVFYTRVYQGGSVVYQVVGPPAGAVIRTLPVGCAAVHVGGIAYHQCGTTYYQPVSGGYRVVVVR